jgi:hypothetical protein
VGNKGYRKYLKVEKNSASVDENKIKYEARFDGKWVLTTNTALSAEQVALKYKELWRVERVFRDVKSLLITRPIFHQRDRTIPKQKGSAVGPKSNSRSTREFIRRGSRSRLDLEPTSAI